MKASTAARMAHAAASLRFGANGAAVTLERDNPPFSFADAQILFDRVRRRNMTPQALTVELKALGHTVEPEIIATFHAVAAIYAPHVRGPNLRKHPGRLVETRIRGFAQGYLLDEDEKPKPGTRWT